MGTRSLTIVEEDEGVEICVLYRQYDGYPTGHGVELKEFLEGFTIVNGLSMKETRRVANGMGCLAAQLIAYFKKDAGGFYLHPSGTRDCGEEYLYTVYLHEKGAIHPQSYLRLKIQAGAVTFFGLAGTKQCHMPVIYDGPVDAFDPKAVEETWANRDEEPINDFVDEQILSSQIFVADNG